MSSSRGDATRPPQGMSDDPEIWRAVRRTVGIAALRRLRRLVDADNEREARSPQDPLGTAHVDLLHAGRLARARLDGVPLE